MNHTTQGNPFRSDRTDNRRLLKFMLALGIVITLAVGFMLSTTRIARAETPPNGDPGGALVVDNGTHTIAGNSQLWYRFDYAGDRSPITIRLVYGTLSGLSFNVFTQDGALNPGGGTPIGRGTGQAVFCASGEPGFIRDCLADDLTWVGGSRGATTYYVEVLNSNGAPISFLMTAEGTGVVVATPAPTTAPTTASSVVSSGQVTTTISTVTPPSPSPTATATITATSAQNNSAGAALPLDNGTHTIAGNSQLWYRFDYAGDRSPIAVRLVNGTNSGLSFNVFTQDGALNPGGGTPIGRGTAQAVFCGSGEPGFIQACLATDLNWVGGSRGSATYYVEVVNSNGSPLSFQLTVEGSGVTPGK